MLALIAAGMLLLYAFKISPDAFNLGWLGLAVLAFAIALGNWPFDGTIIRRRQ